MKLDMTQSSRPAIALLGLMALGSVAYAVTKDPSHFSARVLEGLACETVALYAGGIAFLGAMALKDNFINPHYSSKDDLFGEKRPRLRIFGPPRTY